MKLTPTLELAGRALLLAACFVPLCTEYAHSEEAKKKDKKIYEDEATIELDPIVIADGLENKDTITNSEVGSDLIDRTQSATIPGLLSNLPGVDLIGNSRVQGQSINMMGFGDSEDIDITIDGAQKSFEKYQQGSIFLEPELVKVIDVSKGTFSPGKYGAFSGSVEMTTKGAEDMLRDGQAFGAFAKTGFSSNGNEFVKSAALYGQSEDYGLNLLVAATHRNNDDYSIAGNTKTLDLSAGSMLSGHFKASLVKENHFFELGGQYGYSDDYKPSAARRGIITPSDYSLNKYGSYENYLRTQAVDREINDMSLSGKYNYNPDSDLIDLTLKASYSNTSQHDTRRVPDGFPDYSASLSAGGDESWLDYSIYKLEVENISNFILSGFENTAHYGVQVRHEIRDSMAYKKGYADEEKYNYGYLQPYNIPSGTQTVVSTWAEDTIHLGRLDLTPGLRYDFIRTEGEANLAPIYNNPDMEHDYGIVDRFGFSPSISAVFALTDNVKLFGDYTYKLRAPLIDEMYDVGSLRATSTQLENERVSAKRVGIASTFNNVLTRHDTVRGRVSFYRNDVSSNVYRLLSDNKSRYDDPAPTYGNLSGYHTQGFEAELYYDSDTVFGSAIYSTMEGKHNGTLKDTQATYDQYVSEVAPEKLVVTLGYKFSDLDLTAGWKGRFVAAQNKVPTNWTSLFEPSKGYSVHDAFVSWAPREGRLAGLEARASVENIFNRDYRPYFAESNAPEKGINFKGSLSFKF